LADEDRGQLPQRVRGASRGGSGSAPSPVLSAEVRQRIQAAVKAEREEAASKAADTTGPSGPLPTSGQASDDAVTTATTGPNEVNGVNGVNGVTGAKKQRQRAPKPRHPAKPGHLVRPAVADESERTIPPALTAQPEHAAPPKRIARPARPATAGPVAEDEVTEWLGPAVTPQPAVTPPAAGQRRRRRHTVLLVALAVALAAAGSLTVVTVRHLAGSPTNSAAMLREEASIRDQAAAWVAQQVGGNFVVSCDPAMCHALTVDGFPAHNLLVLEPATLVPVASAVVVETQAVVSLFGTSLASAWAPAVLASFGSGPAEITVRVIARNGAASYENELNADMAARKKTGDALLNDNQIRISSLAQEQLASGQVDSRLMVAIAALAGHQPISILDFGSTGPGVSANLPLRFADLAKSDQASHLGSAAYVRSMRSYLGTVDAQYRPARTETVVAGGQAVLRVEFTAPSPLGVFGLQGLP
jgi:hypothetical protein